MDRRGPQPQTRRRVCRCDAELYESALDGQMGEEWQAEALLDRLARDDLSARAEPPRRGS
jgi:hypothetical protein